MDTHTVTSQERSQRLRDVEQGRLGHGVAWNDRDGGQGPQRRVVDDRALGLLQLWQEGASHIERPKEIDGELLLESIGVARIIVEGNACVVDEYVQSADFGRSLLNLRGVSDIQLERRYAIIGMLKVTAYGRVDALHTSLESLLNQGTTNPALATRNKNRFVCDVHRFAP